MGVTLRQFVVVNYKNINYNLSLAGLVLASTSLTRMDFVRILQTIFLFCKLRGVNLRERVTGLYFVLAEFIFFILLHFGLSSVLIVLSNVISLSEFFFV